MNDQPDSFKAPMFSGSISGLDKKEMVTAEGTPLEAVNPSDNAPHYRVNMIMTEDLTAPEGRDHYHFYLRLQRSLEKDGAPVPGGVNYFPVNETTLPNCKDQFMKAWEGSLITARFQVIRKINCLPLDQWERVAHRLS